MSLGVVLAMVIPMLGSGVAVATPAAWNDANFKLVWERTDKAVQDGMTARSWMWGSDTVPGSPGTEPYADSPGGNRVVQYFDKSRMEVNDPAGDRSSLWFVTNGLLVKEMVSGKVQMGNAAFTNKGPSSEAVAGDPVSANPNSPTYATFTGIASLNNDNAAPPEASAADGIVKEFIDKAGNITTGASPDASVRHLFYDGNLKHNIPNVFFDFMNQSGLVYWNGGWSTETVINWVFAMGYPITEPYWTKAKVAGVEKDVLVQLYERRVLTYTPSNPPGFQVEMGNVGQHYYRWRYQAPAAEQRIAFASDRSGSVQIWTMKTTGGDLKQLTSAGENYMPSWSPDNSKIAFSSTRDGSAEIYVMNADGSGQTRLTFDTYPDGSPYWSPDGSRLAWSKEGDAIFTMTANGGNVLQLNVGALLAGSPVYSPDGTRLAWTGRPAKSWDSEVYTGNLDGSAANKLTLLAATMDYPVDWKGGKILFISLENKGSASASQLWSMDDDGGNQKKLGGNADKSARFSPDGGRIVLERSDDVYIVNNDGSNPVNVTNAAGYDGDPDWSN